jgi:hypothetical protein
VIEVPNVPSTHNDGKHLATVSMISTGLQMSVSVPPQAAGTAILNGSISFTRAKIAASSSTA